jgi:GDSL-like Lipase/Acylhydrolase family
MAQSSGRVPMLDETGRFPDRFAPPSVAADKADAETARTGAETARTGAETARAGAEAAQAAAEAVPTTNDGITSGLVEDTGSDTRAALNATYAAARRAVYGPRWVFDGDSITFNGLSTVLGNQDRSRSWTSEMARQSMGRIRYIFNAAVSGYRSDQILARFDAFVAPQNPDVVLLTIGTNDIGQGFTMASWLANVQAYYDKCKAIGADLVIGAVWPTDATDVAGRGATTRTWNTALYDWASTNKVQVIGWDSLADPITGGWPAGWSGDNLHPSVVGAVAYATIGKFGWQSVEPKAGPANIRRATMNGADGLANGMLTATAIQAPPNLTAGTPDTASGTLPAGTYSYKYTSRTYWGESLPSAERQVTLSGTGKITITNSTVSGSRGYRVYRKAPGDSTWKYLTFLSPSTVTSFVDDGSIAAGADMSGVDTSPYPTGLVAGGSSVKAIGPVILTEAGVKGNIFRLMPNESGTGTAPNDYFAVTVVPGEVWSASTLIRTSGSAEGVFVIRFRDAGNVLLGSVIVARDRMINGWGLAHHQITVPANAATARVGFELFDNAAGYADFAEAQFRKIS